MTLYVVSGPPCGGKTTWVRNRARAADLVVDMDAIAVAMSGTGAPTHGHTGAVFHVAHAARRAAIDLIETEKLYLDRRVYLIHAQPTEPQKARYRRMGAQLVVLDPGRDEVQRRFAEDRRPAGTRAWIDKWYDEEPEAPASASPGSGARRRW